VLTQFPDPVGAQVVSWLLAHLGTTRFIDYTRPYGRALLQTEAVSISKSPAEAMRGYLLDHPLPATAHDAAIPLLVRWIHAELRTEAPVKVRLSSLFFVRRGATMVELTRAVADRIAEGMKTKGMDWNTMPFPWVSIEFISGLGTLFRDDVFWDGDKEAAGVTGLDILLAAWFSVLAAELPTLLDWIAGHRAEADRMSLLEALQAATRWHRAQAKAAREGVAAEGTVVATLPKGLGTIRELGVGDLRAESLAMGHCVGESPVYARGIQSGDLRILSVRDAAGKVWFTIEAKHTWNGAMRTIDWNVVQMKGAKNRIPGLSAGATRARPPGTIAVTRDWLRANPRLVQTADLAIGEAVLHTLPSLGIRVPVDPHAALTADLEVLLLARMGELPDGSKPG
jgi:hypothetical protein